MEYLLVIAAYCVGAIPFGLLFGKMAGVDVRKSGSGNIGATNVNRLLGKKMGALTLAADVAKGYLPMLLAAWLLGTAEGADRLVMICGGAAFLGHLFPVYLGFKGGKGVATALGVFLYLDPLAVLLALALFIAVVSVSGYVSVGSLSAAAAFPVIAWQFGATPSHLWLGGFVAVLIWAKHHENIGRLLRREEKSFKKGGEAKA